MNSNPSLHSPLTSAIHMPIKSLLIISLACLAVLIWVSSAMAQTGTISGSVVNIRSGPGSSYEIVGTVLQDTEVTIQQKQGDWYKVSLGKTTGWVSASLLSTSTKSNPTVQVTGELVNLRSGPGTGYSKVGQAAQGETLTLIDVQGDWYKVRTAGGLECYIAASLAGRTAPPAAGSTPPVKPTTPAPAGKQVQVVDGPINVRSGPASTYEKLGMIPNQGVFPVVSTQNDWHQILLTDGSQAWVAGWLVKEVSGTAITSPTVPDNTPAQGTSANPVVYLDGKKLSFEVAPIIQEGRTLVPLRAIFESMGAQVGWNAAARTVTATRAGIKVILPLGSLQPTVNGQVWPLDVPAKIVNDRTLAPLRFVGEAFGGKVNWDQATYTVTMTSPASQGKPTSVVIAEGPVNLRSGPGTEQNQVDQAQVGERLPILAERDGWYQVSRSGRTGWVAGWVVNVAWEANEPLPDPNLPIQEEPPVTPPPSRPEKPGADVIWLSCQKDEGGYQVGIESGAAIEADIKERSREVIYKIKDRQVEGKYYFEEKLAKEKLTIKGENDGDDVVVTVAFPSGTEYRTASEQGGKKEILRIPNFILDVERKTFGSSGERLIVTTALPAKYSGQQKGDKLEVKLEGVLLGAADDEYSFRDSDLIDSVSLSKSGDTALLITVNTDDLGKYSLGLGGSAGNELNIMLVDRSAVKPRRENLVVLDPGHGGTDPGACGSLVHEKKLNLELALMVGEILKDKGVDVEYTRETDLSVGLEERSRIANNLNAALFVSIHHNGEAPDKQGTETFFYAPPENPDLFMQRDERQRLAAAIHQRLINNLRRTDRGVKQSNYSVLRNTQMPSALAEICFITNPEEQNLAMQQNFKELAAQAIAGGILQYMGK